ncbi:MAG: HEAT repeat domain-containing protein, partial [Alphaproteobacteria bacterium]|nr:HEAT repeat domain-containing protein [Alphaproteobacteria bacterium]
ALIAALAAERDLIVRADIVSALGAYRRPRAVAALAGLLDGKGNASLRRKAIGALGRTGSHTATAPLLAALGTAQADGERAAIVAALSQIADPAARPALERLFDASKAPLLKVRIAAALGAIRDGSAVPKLIVLLEHELAAVRFFAVDALATANDRRAAEPLRRLYRRASAAAELPDGRAGRPAITAFLASQSLRLAVIRALITLDPGGSVAEFLDAAAPMERPRTSAVGLRLNEGIYELRRAAIVGLGYSRTATASRYLADGGILADRDFRLRATALRALGVLRQPASAPAVVALLDDGVAEARWVAAKVLGRLGNTDAANDLRLRLGDPHPEVRRQAALSLGFLGDRQACPELAGLVGDDPAKQVREAAQATRSHLCRPN